MKEELITSKLFGIAEIIFVLVTNLTVTWLKSVRLAFEKIYSYALKTLMQ